MSVTTLYGTALSSSSILLTGTLDDLHGEASLDVSFEWGATSAYGNETTPEAISSTGLVSASIDATTLDDFHTTGNTYHFRVKATDGVTTWYGDDRQFAVLLLMGSDPYVIDNEMTDGTLTDVVVFKDVMTLAYVHGMREYPDFSGVQITAGSKIPVTASPVFSGAQITGGTVS